MARIPMKIGIPLLAAFGYGALYLVANRMVFHPMKFPKGMWDLQFSLGAADVWLRTADGVRLHAWWIPRPGARLATLFFHGNAGNLSHRFTHLREITAAGSSAFIVDYRGYGKSEGSPSEKGLYADAEAAYRHLLAAGYKPAQIIFHGESLGSSVAVDLAVAHHPAGVVLEAPFPSARAMASRILPVLGPLVAWGWNSEAKIAAIGAPLLVIHGNRDEVVPFDLGRRLYQAARDPKWFYAVPEAGHNDILEVAGAAYRERLRAFYAGLP